MIVFTKDCKTGGVPDRYSTSVPSGTAGSGGRRRGALACARRLPAVCRRLGSGACSVIGLPPDRYVPGERKLRVEEVWKKMNSGLPVRVPKLSANSPSSSGSTKTEKRIPDWMVSLGLSSVKKPASAGTLGKRLASNHNGTTEEAKRLAAAALSAAKDVASAAAAAGRGKIEITEVRDFAGQDIEVKKLVDADSREATEKARVASAPPSALDSILEQIKKKQKLSVLDKTKKDWSEFKDENKGLDEELDAYKKSSNQYLDKVSFLQRTDHREFERERDARLAMQAKRRPDMREDDF